jgi:uncharacterized protein (TIGR00299 family) protein
MPRVLYFDCFAGASGDMVLGALLDAGLPIHELEQALGSLMIPGYRLAADRVLRSGLSATQFRLIEGNDEPAEADASEAPAHGHQHAHPRGGRDHDHHDHDPEPAHGSPGGHHGHAGHAHRSLGEITALIDRSSLPDRARARAISLFTRLAEAEAEVHQMPVSKVHLHEVGELDSIVDIVGAVFGLDWFGADRILASPMNVGGGMVRSAHGVFPVPAPATAKLLLGVPVYSSGVQMETVTPTGALLVTGHATAYGPLPAMRIEHVGYGAGGRDLPGTPNVLRILVGRADDQAPADRVVVLECEIDDMNPQIFGPVMDQLYAAGALEVFFSAVQMKKNRPGTLLTIVGRPESREELAGIVFRETTTIGLRYQEVARACLSRETVLVETPVGPVRVKVASRGGDVMNAAPEFEDCARLAAAHGVAIKKVQALATKAYWELGTKD